MQPVTHDLDTGPPASQHEIRIWEQGHGLFACLSLFTLSSPSISLSLSDLHSLILFLPLSCTHTGVIDNVVQWQN